MSNSHARGPAKVVPVVKMIETASVKTIACEMISHKTVAAKMIEPAVETIACKSVPESEM